MTVFSISTGCTSCWKIVENTSKSPRKPPELFCANPVMSRKKIAENEIHHTGGDV